MPLSCIAFNPTIQSGQIPEGAGGANYSAAELGTLGETMQLLTATNLTSVVEQTTQPAAAQTTLTVPITESDVKAGTMDEARNTMKSLLASLYQLDENGNFLRDAEGKTIPANTFQAAQRDEDAGKIDGQYAEGILQKFSQMLKEEPSSKLGLRNAAKANLDPCYKLDNAEDLNNASSYLKSMLHGIDVEEIRTDIGKLANQTTVAQGDRDAIQAKIINNGKGKKARSDPESKSSLQSPCIVGKKY